MAEPTGFITSTGGYNNNDLNTIFAPIINIDSGTFASGGTTIPNPIGEGWSTFTGITTDTTVQARNVGASSSGFTINRIGIYRLNISLRFGTPHNERYQPIVFILNSNTTLPDDYTFIPYPALSDIYSFGGLSVAGTGTLTNRNNQISLANALQTNATGNQYMFAFELENINTNIATLEITFIAPSSNSVIYPQIRCRQGSPNPQITLLSGRWLFEKLN